MREIDIQKRVLLALSQAGLLVWDHPTGSALSPDILRHVVQENWVGRRLADVLKPGRDYRRIAYGLDGSSDLVGILPGGRFLGCEIKTPDGTQQPNQKKFEAAVNRVGGIYIVARSPDEALAQIRAAGAL
ncbi:hypothetical protein [Shumkonia mesophila]|uniref:hypothetical protein n=1 Tax=Shumkonia mesophila TaxID=2838854 RepID=UPI002934DD58|nr:hypothetical protein [Shumkonia mesophila]